MGAVRAHHVHIEHRFAKAPARIFDHLAEHENLAEVFDAKITRLRDGQDGERNGVGSVRELRIGPLPPSRRPSPSCPPPADRLPDHQGQSRAATRA